GDEALCRRVLFEDLLPRGLPGRLARHYSLPIEEVRSHLLSAANSVIEKNVGRGATARSRRAVFATAVRNEAIRLISGDETPRGTIFLDPEEVPDCIATDGTPEEAVQLLELLNESEPRLTKTERRYMTNGGRVENLSRENEWQIRSRIFRKLKRLSKD